MRYITYPGYISCASASILRPTPSLCSSSFHFSLWKHLEFIIWHTSWGLRTDNSLCLVVSRSYLIKIEINYFCKFLAGPVLKFCSNSRNATEITHNRLFELENNIFVEAHHPECDVSFIVQLLFQLYTVYFINKWPTFYQFIVFCLTAFSSSSSLSRTLSLLPSHKTQDSLVISQKLLKASLTLSCSGKKKSVRKTLKPTRDSFWKFSKQIKQHTLYIFSNFFNHTIFHVLL